MVLNGGVHMHPIQMMLPRQGRQQEPMTLPTAQPLIGGVMFWDKRSPDERGYIVSEGGSEITPWADQTHS